MTKPAANHPWRIAPSSSAVSWAREQSQVREVSNVNVARPETLKRKTQVTHPSR